MIEFATFLKISQQRINNALTAYLPTEAREPQRLHQAMRHTVLSNGKRIRPLLVYAVGETLGARSVRLDIAAAAIELIHSYSLVHDDLPAMDDDDIRRGQPSCHKAFGEATAILAGDALFNLAFQLLLTKGDYQNEIRLELLKTVADACSSNGMVGGQALEFEISKPTAKQLEQINLLKTGALIRAAIKLGAIVAKAAPEQLAVLDEYGKCLGLAFQLQDDILDNEAQDDSAAKLKHLKQQMQHLLQQLNVDHALLAALTQYIVQ